MTPFRRYALSAAKFSVFGLPIAAALLIPALQSSPAPAQDSDGGGLQAFASEAEFTRFARQMQQLQRTEARRYQSEANDIVVTGAALPAPPPAAAEAMADAAAVAADAPEGEQITNTQEQGVDEGAIVKDAGDYLVVLRRGRIFTIRHGGNALAPVDAIDAFPPGKDNPGAAWYDEMLVRGDQVIVIGYSYGDYGTEINRFRIGRDGRLSYRDTHYLRSGDYYSSSNYASRMIGDELVFYAPVVVNWGNWRSTMPSLRDGDGREIELLNPEDIHAAAPYRGGRVLVNVAHTVTRCDLSAPELDCSARAVLGTWSRTFYVSRSAVYVWTGEAEGWRGERSHRVAGQLYRLPFDWTRPGAVPVAGGPVDQFSFAEDAQDRMLRVVLRGEGADGNPGDAMWGAEFSDGDVGLLNVPLSAFGNGSGRLPRSAMRELPQVEQGQFHNRFAGDWLLYAVSQYWGGRGDPTVHAVPLDGGAVQSLKLAHEITRFDVMGSDAIAIGATPGGRGREGGLGFTALSLGRRVGIEDFYRLPAAGEGETRSQAFFYRPDAGSPGGVSGTLGLPVTRALQGRAASFLGSGSAIFYLRRDNRRFSPAGELVAETARAVDDGCIASCVDWYGNARPIFLGNRVFALMGYELVEGRLSGGRISEVRRVDFSPRDGAERRRD